VVGYEKNFTTIAKVIWIVFFLLLENCHGQFNDGLFVRQLGIQDILRIEVDLFGKKVDAMIDSGAPLCIIDSQFDLNLTGSTSKLAKRGEMVFWSDLTLNTLNRPIKYSPVATTDLAPMSKIFAADIKAVLGAPFLANRILGSKDGHFYVADDDFAHKNHDAQAVQVDLYGMCHTKDVKLIDNNPRSFLIDTGFNSAVCIDTLEFTKLYEQGHISGVRIGNRIGVIGPTQFRCGVLRHLVAWDVEFFDVPVYEGGHFSVGLALLSKFNFSLNVQKKSLTISRRRDVGADFLIDQSGLGLKSDSDRIMVGFVHAGSKASELGFLVGDQIETVGGEVVRRKDINDLRSMLSDYQKWPVKMRVKRKGKSIEIIFKGK